ncbi:MAG TPA: DNA repair protein RecN [Chromatiales bacterium]|jgi:DNA repair protein RecN (Recombination protein N)|nr:DNA repair protein RecN [Chromatiales bacterium]
MITQIQVRNLAIVERLDLDLQSGLTVVTGETGAGKSIVVDALAFALGERSDTSVIRSGCDRAEVSVCFEPDDRSIVPAWLTAQELDLDGECVLRRTLSKEGRSRASINGRTVTLQTLRELGNLLADIHGQHAHQSLLHRDQQRDLLDQFGDYHKQCTQVRDSYRQWHACAQQLTALREQVHDRNARLELLRYQVPELDALELQNGEVPQLETDHRRLSHANELLDTAQRSLTQLYEDDEHAANSQIGRVLVQLRELTTLDPSLETTCQLLDTALIQIDEATSSLRDSIDNMNPDPQRLLELERRLDAIQSIARKHHTEPEQLYAVWQQLSDDLQTLLVNDEQTVALETQTRQLSKTYQRHAQALSKKRQLAGKRLATDIEKTIRTLGMPKATFEIVIDSDVEHRSVHGIDAVDYLVCANPGQTPGALSKVASGGELSRIALAIHFITARQGQVPTLVFDEADVGVGGGVAETVGKLLRALGDARQVLCVTHLPQVAAQGHSHLHVSKKQTSKATHTDVDLLAEGQRVDELARMLGGIKITDKTLAHAREMLQEV